MRPRGGAGAELPFAPGAVGCPRRNEPSLPVELPPLYWAMPCPPAGPPPAAPPPEPPPRCDAVPAFPPAMVGWPALAGPSPPDALPLLFWPTPDPPEGPLPDAPVPSPTVDV